LARPDADPELRWIQPETGNLRCDRNRLMPVERENPYTKFDLWRGAGELRQRLQAGSGRLVVRPQRVIVEALTVDG
jgi:hypothetical protein